jgi:DNA polymerase elongation subunit (family B)
MLKEKNYFQCKSEQNMIAEFLNDLKMLDPDVLACHDSAKVLDVLIQRMAQLNERSEKPRLGRLIHFETTHAHNQQQRLTNAISGRLLADTYTHSKDMIKSIDYELESMARNIKPERQFTGLNDEEIKSNLDAGKTFTVIKKVK